MESDIRKDQFFVEDDAWHRASGRYQQFPAAFGEKPLVLLELGVRYNTPTIIKVPFEQITSEHPNAALVRINKNHPEASPANRAKTIAFDQNILKIIATL